MALTFTFDFEATKAALLYLALQELPSFDKYKASKLLFLADREHLLRFGRTITGDAYSALPYGPTPANTLDLLDALERVAIQGQDPMNDQVAELERAMDLSNLEHPTYHAKVDPNPDALSRSDLRVLDHVIQEHGRKSFNELKAMTHGMRAYTNVWRDNDTRKRFPMAFEDFFADVPEKAEFLDELEENQKLEKAFPHTECA
jgi:uncharacterized phage-associated protein